MAYWLYKTEPSTWSWDDQVKAGANGTQWTRAQPPGQDQPQGHEEGRSRLFLPHRRREGGGRHRRGDQGVLPDPTDKTGMFGMVDLKAVKALKPPVTLAEIKAEPKLKGMVLVNNARLSVQPVSDAEWTLVSKLGGA